ncbi:NADP-dependent malic enzyme [Thioflexithrix psekupsensis]|uniref:NADP-dependent malic enzyme n=1 Tax=Thioflexithrix psekupsensis TaxID=1570016 RepID=A0A251XBF5_9GAMM|nr:NADP-dependent malic enzyme [Thioflexithrix psekupsensis]OUD15699.1 NADP-dependent malic enzyme [Thioflexithrix psekupsensis]
MSDDLSADALYYHRNPKPGKLEIQATKPLANQRDLALAYSPGVAAACREIVRDPREAATVTARANLVAVISNGTAVLGLGDIGPLAAKPVMEGKAVLFKKFAGIDVFDLEVSEKNPEKLIDIIASLEPTFGAINLEDIKSPECFIIEQRLKERMNIPVFHDDQHGTAICVGAAVLNALRLQNKQIDQVKLVTSGAGAAALACLDLLVNLGIAKENIIITDSLGVVYQGRSEHMDPFKAQYAVDTPHRTLGEALTGADIFLGLSVAGVLKPEMLDNMVEEPLILALANPVPEIMPEEARKVRPKAIIATGRSDYPNQVNNVLCFPFIFRGALDVGATQINQEMRLACVRALADLVTTDKTNMASADASEVLANAYAGQELEFGADYIIPKPFDPRLIAVVPPVVAKAAMDSGVATRPIKDFESYNQWLAQFMFRSANVTKGIFIRARENPQRLIFSEGEDPRVIRAVQVLIDEGCAKPILVGRHKIISQRIKQLRLHIRPDVDFRLIDPQNYDRHAQLAELYHDLMGRRGVWPAEADVLVRSNTTILASLLLHLGEADALLAGPVGSFAEHLKNGLNLIGLRDDVSSAAAMQMLILDEGTYFVLDTSVTYEPTAQQLAEMTIMAANEVMRLGITPKVALVSHSNFGSSDTPSALKMRQALHLIHQMMPDLECDGEMQTDSALIESIRNRLYPKSPLRGSANLLVMPNQDAASITFNALKALANGVSVGPILLGMKQSYHILSRVVTTRGVVNLSILAAVDAQSLKEGSR